MPHVMLSFDIPEERLSELNSVLAGGNEAVEIRKGIFFFQLPKEWRLQTETTGLAYALTETLAEQAHLHWAGGGEIDLKIAEVLDTIDKSIRKKLGRLCRFVSLTNRP